MQRLNSHSTTQGHEEYFAYLRTRSRLGLLYRKYFLYPRLRGHLQGQILDVGCGLGDMLRFYPGVHGVDINPRIVEWCRSQALRVWLMEPDVLPFSDSAYDSILLDNVLEHIDSPKPLLAEIHRVVKPGGTVLVGVPGVIGYASDSDHKQFYDEERLISTLAEAKFACSKTFAMPLRSDWLDRHARQYCVYGVFKSV